MKNWLKIYQVPVLFCCVCLALVSLMAFQIDWLSKSKKMIEEQFDQKVNLAIGSALSDFNMVHNTELDIEEVDCCDDEDCKIIDLGKEPISKASQIELEDYLQTYMGCFGIDEKYSVNVINSTNNNVCAPEKSFSCTVNPPNAKNAEFQLGVSFESRGEYLYDKMKSMIISSILIFLLLSTVSFIILRALINQKRLTENNIDFFNNTAHELKTPLTNISLSLTMLSKKYKEIADDKFTEIIRTENSKLANQIERVLFLSQMESGEYKLNKNSVNLNELIQAVVDNMQLIAEAKNGKIHIDFPREECIVYGDYYHLSNAVKNLIDNALKYCEKDPLIKIKLSEDHNHVKVSLSDNGIGISKHDQNHIFEKFQRVNTGDVRNTKGFGIGLSYVKTVIEMHRGLISVNSELNKGSQFELLIPNT